MGGGVVRRRRMEEVWVVGEDEGDDQHLLGDCSAGTGEGTVGDEVSC